METLDAIFTRRSVRRFTDKSISKETTETLLRAAMNAPSAHNKQSWQFVVVNERKLLNKLADVHPYGKMCQEAPLAIVCCHDEVLEDRVGFGVQNVSAAIQNILLAARDVDLGSVWLGVYPKEDLVNTIREFFDMPKTVIPIGIVVVGYTDTKQAFVDRYQSDRVHNNKW